MFTAVKRNCTDLSFKLVVVLRTARRGRGTKLQATTQVLPILGFDDLMLLKILKADTDEHTGRLAT